MSAIDYLDLCRLCLVKDQVSVSIFEDEGANQQIFHKIATCLPVKVNRDDRLPQKLCNECVCKVEMFYQYWNTTANAEKQLLQWLNDAGDDKQTYVLDSNVVKSNQSEDEANDQTNNISINVIQLEDMPIMISGEEQMPSVSMTSSTNVQPVAGTSSQAQIIRKGNTNHEVEEGSTEDDNTEDDECDVDEGLKEEIEVPNAQPSYVTIPCDAPGPSGLQQQKMEIEMQQDDDPKSGFNITNGKNQQADNNLEKDKNDKKASNGLNLYPIWIMEDDVYYIKNICEEKSVESKKKIKVEIARMDDDDESKSVPKINPQPKTIPTSSETNQALIVTPLPNSAKSLSDTPAESPVQVPIKKRIPKIVTPILTPIKNFIPNIKTPKSVIIENPASISKSNQNQVITPINNSNKVSKAPVVGKKSVSIESTNSSQSQVITPIKISNIVSLAPVATKKPATIVSSTSKQSQAITPMFKHTPTGLKAICPLNADPASLIKTLNLKTSLIPMPIENQSKDTIPINSGVESSTSTANSMPCPPLVYINSAKRVSKLKKTIPSIRKRDDDDDNIDYEWPAELVKKEPKIPEKIPEKCVKCNKMFASYRSLKKHLVRIHQEEKPFECDHCQKRFSAKDLLKNHIFSAHMKRFVCDICGMPQISMFTLNQHKRKHTGEYFGKCRICDRGFYSKNTLLSHEKTHAGTKPHKCPHCDAAYSAKSYLKYHIRVVHDKSEKTYKCTVCDYETCWKHSFKKHVYIHTGEKQVVCEVCTKVISNKYYYKIHMRTHTKEKPMICEYCGKAFSTKKYLLCHIRTHTGEKPYQCPYCEKRFNQHCSLRVHKQWHLKNK